MFPKVPRGEYVYQLRAFLGWSCSSDDLNILFSSDTARSLMIVTFGS